MAQINVEVPDYWLEWIDKKRSAMGFRSRRALMMKAVEVFAEIPSLEALTPIKQHHISETWPLEECHHICPRCAGMVGGVKIPVDHCGGFDVPMINKMEQIRMLWICDCPTCSKKSQAQATA